MYGWAVLAAVLIVLGAVTEPYQWLPAKWQSKAKPLTVAVLCALLAAALGFSFAKGRYDAEQLMALNFDGPASPHYQQIVMPPESSAQNAAQCFTWSPPTTNGFDPPPLEYEFLVAETADSYHVVEVVEESDPGSQVKRSIRYVRPVVFSKQMVQCYRRILPGLHAVVPHEGPSQTPTSLMPTTSKR